MGKQSKPDVELTVRRALAADRRQAYVRIAKKDRDRIEIEVGETVRVRHGRHCIVLPVAKGDRQLVGSDACRLNAGSRTRLNVKPGDSVRIEKLTKLKLVGDIDSSVYDLVICEKGVKNPFQISSSLMDVTRRVVRNKRTTESRARAIFTWMNDNIHYGSRRRGSRIRYRDAMEVKLKQEGVCGEQAYLYVAMARLAGLVSRFVHVTRDFQGKAVQHACAAVDVDSAWVLVDPAYHMYGVKHRKFKILSDVDSQNMFRGLRG